MSSSNSLIIKQRIPPSIIFIYRICPETPYNRKYAPKFLGRLKISQKKKLSLRTRYTKKVLCLEAPPKSQEQFNHLLLKVANRFRKFCKGDESLDKRLLSSFYSIEKCRLIDIFYFPGHFKLGRFTKLTLKFQKNLQAPKQISKIIRKIKRSKLLNTLTIHFGESTLDVSRLFFSELQKYPQIISSFLNFGLIYRQRQDDLNINLHGNIIQSVTHLILNLKRYQMFTIDLQNLTKLNYLDLTLTSPHENHFAKLNNSLEALKNLETLILTVAMDSFGEIRSLLDDFRPPKSIKKFSLTRISNVFDCSMSLTEIFSRSQTLSEVWNDALTEGWRELDQLSDLTLTLKSEPAYSDIDFLLMAQILQRCQYLKRLTMTTTCFSCGPLDEHCGHLEWTDLLRALEPSKDTLEYLEINACKISSERNEPSNITFKHLKDFKITTLIMEARGLRSFSSIIPLQNCNFSSSVIIPLNNELEILEFFNSLEYIPKQFCAYLDLLIGEINPETFEKELRHYLSSAKIEGQLYIFIYEPGPLDPERFMDLIPKTGNLTGSGVLEISLDPKSWRWGKKRSLLFS